MLWKQRHGLCEPVSPHGVCCRAGSGRSPRIDARIDPIGMGSSYVMAYQHCSAMPRAKKKLILSQPIKEGLKAIKVQLDHRTVITLASLKALDFWKKRYPQAVVIG